MDRAQTIALFAEAPSLRAVLSILEMARPPPRVAGHFAVLATRRAIHEVVESLSQSHLKIISSSAAHLSLVVISDGESEEQAIPIFIEKSSVAGFIFVFSYCKGDEWRERVGHFVRRLYPFVFSSFMPQGNLRLVAERLKASIPANQTLRVVKVSQTRPLLQRLSRRRTESGIRWTDVPLQDAFDDAEANTIHFKKVALQACIERDREIAPTDLTVSLSSDCSVSTTTRPAWVFESILHTIVELSEQALVFARNHTRESATDSSSPFIAEFRSDFPIRKDDVKKIAKELRRLSDASVSIFSPGPHLRASINDYLDGSNYEVLLTSETKLLVIPMSRATLGSITRVIRFIYDSIGEADFKNQETAES